MSKCFSQNILSNGSFEHEKKLLFTPESKTWKVCIPDDSPDIFCFNDLKTKEIFSMYKGGTYPLSGNCVLGLFVYRVDPIRHYQNVREYAYEKLNTPLKKDSLYNIDLYIFLDDESNVAVKNFDLYFAKNRIEAKNLRSIFKMVPQVSFNKSFLDSSHWMQLHSEYKATGNENYIAIGNFRPDSLTNIKHILPVSDDRKSKWNLEDGEMAAYYYVDNICITPVKSVNITTVNYKDNDTIEEHQVFKLLDIQSDTTITVRNIYFTFDNADIMDQSREILLQLADALKKSPSLNIEIQGHTDNVGSDTYNMELSEKRAKLVYTFLYNNDISLSRMTYKGYGNTIPVADNSIDVGRGLNRRVVFRIYKK